MRAPAGEQPIGVDAPRVLQLAGYLTASFGGSANTYLRRMLEPRARSSTVLRMSETAYGRVDDKLKQQLHEGWTLLFEQGLKPYVEGQDPDAAAH